VGAAFRGHRVDIAIACTVVGLYAIPTAVIAVLVRLLVGSTGPRIVYAVITLALALVAAPTGQQRSAMASVIAQDHVAAAIARGAGRARALIVHVLRNALLPVVTLATLEAPMALGGAFVVEHVFDLHGVGEATIRAVQDRDINWLMAISLVAAGLSAVFVVLTDVAYMVIDHRIEPLILARKGRV
jgi:ABC-type dipeptide/oligopeptide/nickel transport system permease component